MSYSNDVLQRVYSVCNGGRSFDECKGELKALLAGDMSQTTAEPVTTKEAVAWLGLGAMGSGMATRLRGIVPGLKAWNRSEHSLKTVSSVAQACEGGVSVVFSMLSNDAAVREVVLGKGGVLESLQPGAIHVSFSTISPALVAELSLAHKQRNQKFVCCPVFGRPDVAAKGSLFLLPGSDDDEALQILQPFFEVIGQKLFPFKSPEQAALAKVCGNFMIASTVEMLGEVFTLAEKGAGIAPEKMLELLCGTLFGSPVVQRYGGILCREEFVPCGFALDLGLKDVQLFNSACERARVPAPLGSLLKDRFLASLAHVAPGDDMPDWASIVTSIRRESGLPEKRNNK